MGESEDPGTTDYLALPLAATEEIVATKATKKDGGEGSTMKKGEPRRWVTGAF